LCTRTISKRVREKRRIYFTNYWGGDVRYKPRTVIVSSDGNFQLRRMRWRNWNHGIARGQQGDGE
jgi:hypothetical protein